MDKYLNKIICGDCLEVMKGMPDKCVDLVLTDPPYPEMKGGIQFMDGGVASHRNKSLSIGTPWNTTLDWMDEAWRISRYGMFVFCSFHSVDTVKQRLRDHAIALITWHKRNTPPPVNNAPHFSTEFVWVFKKEPGLHWRRVKTFYGIPKLATGCMRSKERVCNPDGTAVHPTQKPLQLIGELLGVEPTSVLDPFAGTGTTCVSCAIKKIPYIGIELNPEYCAIAEERIRQATRQTRMFV